VTVREVPTTVRKLGDADALAVRSWLRYRFTDNDTAAQHDAAAHPDDWRALRLVERALHGSPEADKALAQLCVVSANTAPECANRGARRTKESSADAKQ
jgi:hypothetical protein